MAFIDDAKELLTEIEFAKLQLLGKKSADFETTQEEDQELVELKALVKKKAAQRDAEKNLEFLKTGQYSVATILQIIKNQPFSIKEVLQILEVDQKELAKATKEIWPKAATSTDVTETIATYKIGEKTYEIKMGERLEDREIGAAIKQGGVKKFIANLTEFGKEWITKSHVSDQGPFSGKTIFPNINSVALRFKFEKNDLKKELKIKE